MLVRLHSVLLGCVGEDTQDSDRIVTMTQNGESLKENGAVDYYNNIILPLITCFRGSLKITMIGLHNWVQITSRCSQGLARCHVTIQRCSAAPAPKLSAEQKSSFPLIAWGWADLSSQIGRVGELTCSEGPRFRPRFIIIIIIIRKQTTSWIGAWMAYYLQHQFWYANVFHGC